MVPPCGCGFTIRFCYLGRQLGASWGPLGGLLGVLFGQKGADGVKHHRVLLPDVVLNPSKTIPGPSRDPPKTPPGPSQEPQGTLPGPFRDLPGPLQERLSDQSSPQDGPRTPYSHAPNPTTDAKIWRAIHAQSFRVLPMFASYV